MFATCALDSDHLFKKITLSYCFQISQILSSFIQLLLFSRELAASDYPPVLALSATDRREQDKLAICNLPNNFTWFARAGSAGMVFPSC